ISIDLRNGERFSGVFAYDNLDGQSTDACGAISIVDPIGNPASAGYAFGVNCANGVEQHVAPYIDNIAFYDTLLAEGFEATTDRSTGIITIAGVGRFKPSFFTLPLSSADATYRSNNALANGIAVRALDANGD